MSNPTPNAACWFEIAVSDIEVGRAFYAEVLQKDLTVDHSGPNPTVVLSNEADGAGIGGHLYPGNPSKDGSTIHLIAPAGLDAARDRIKAAGGTVESPDISIPMGAFFYARDPDGNSIGLFNFSA